MLSACAANIALRETETYKRSFDLSLNQDDVLFRLRELFATGKLQLVTVPKKNSVTLTIIRNMGAIIMVNEPNYLVVAGDESQIKEMESLKYNVRTPIESDYKYRAIRIPVKTTQEVQEIRRVCSDVLPVGNIPGHVYCRVLDYQCEILQKRGYYIERKQVNGFMEESGVPEKNKEDK